MLSVTISTKVIVWLCKELNCEALWAEEFAQSFITFLQASGSISIAREKETSEKEMLRSLVFWMEELLTLAREVQKDLMRFYVPEKGYPPHIQNLIAPTDYDTVLADAKKMLEDGLLTTAAPDVPRPAPLRRACCIHTVDLNVPCKRCYEKTERKGYRLVCGPDPDGEPGYPPKEAQL